MIVVKIKKQHSDFMDFALPLALAFASQESYNPRPAISQKPYDFSPATKKHRVRRKIVNKIAKTSKKKNRK